MRNVNGKVAFITGGASGIGLGMASVFVKAGMKAVISDFRRDHLDESDAYFRQKGQRDSILLLELDVTDRDAFLRAAIVRDSHQCPSGTLVTVPHDVVPHKSSSIARSVSSAPAAMPIWPPGTPGSLGLMRISVPSPLEAVSQK